MGRCRPIPMIHFFVDHRLSKILYVLFKVRDVWPQFKSIMSSIESSYIYKLQLFFCLNQPWPLLTHLTQYNLDIKCAHTSRALQPRYTRV